MGRIIGSFLLLFTQPFSPVFFLLYILCGVSDAIDGLIARKTRTASKLGEVLDTVADLIFIIIVLIIFVPRLTLELWMYVWIISIAVIRFLTLAIGFIKYRALSFLHTYSNKATTAVFFLFPFLFLALGLPATVAIICLVATISALEEIMITLSSKQLNRNMPSIFTHRHSLS